MKREIKKVVCILISMSLICGLNMEITPVWATKKLKTTTITSVKEGTNATVKVKWKKNSSAKGYYIYRKTNKNGKYKKIATVKKNSVTSYIDKSTKDNTTYYYAMKSYNGKKQSTYSVAKKIKTSSSPKLEVADINKCGAVAEQETDVTFSVKIKNSVRVKDNSVKIKCEGDEVGILKDDGKNGDLKKGDGIYTCIISTSGTAGETKKYYITLGTQKSNELGLTFFDELSSEDFEEQEMINDEMCSIADVFEEKKDSIEAVYQKACELMEDGRVINIEKNDYSVIMRLKSGIWYAYAPEEESLEAGSGDTTLVVKTFQPYNFEGDGGLESTKIDEAANFIDTLDNCHFVSGNNYDNEEVTLEKVDSICENQIVIWNGHGGYTEQLGPYSVTGKLSQKEKILYGLDFLSGALILTGERAGITSKYVMNHLSNLNNSLIYIGTCLGAKDLRLVNAYIGAGASTVCAFDDSVLKSYDQGAIYYIFEKMSSINDNTGYYYSINEAVSLMQKEDAPLGPCSQYEENGVMHNAYLHIFGNRNYRLSNKCILELSLNRTMDTLLVGKSTKIIAKISNVKKPSVKWIIKDSRIASVKISKDGLIATIKGKSPGTTILTCIAGDKRIDCAIYVKENKIPDGVYYAGFTGTKTNDGTLYKATYNNGKVHIYGSFIKQKSFDDLTIIGNLPYAEYEVEVDFKNFYQEEFDYETYISKKVRYSKKEVDEWFTMEYRKFWSKPECANGLAFVVVVKNGKAVCIQGMS